MAKPDGEAPLGTQAAGASASASGQLSNPTEFAVRQEVRAGIRIVSVHGELDLQTAPQVEAVFGEPSSDAARLLVIDLTACEFIDSSGVLTLLREAEAGDASVVSPGDSPVRRTLELIEIPEDVMPVFSAVEHALEAASVPA